MVPGASERNFQRAKRASSLPPPPFLPPQATTLGEDDARLTVPGRVWFTKPRRLKNGATLARVMQGNLKEDMLWQLHDIMLTKSMLSHHRLDKYIKILDRV